MRRHYPTTFFGETINEKKTARTDEGILFIEPGNVQSRTAKAICTIRCHNLRQMKKPGRQWVHLTCNLWLD